MTAGTGGRWVCTQCGANNFETVANCWKCGTAQFRPTTSPPPAYSTPPRSETPSVLNSPVYAAPTSRNVLDGDPAVAKRAALLLALTFPWLGLPIGWAFMMIEDQRRQAIGRYCAWVSFFGLLAHLFFGMIALKGATTLFMNLLVPVMQSMDKSHNSSPNVPDLSLPSER